jgi:hypothetical protein
MKSRMQNLAVSKLGIFSCNPESTVGPESSNHGR